MRSPTSGYDHEKQKKKEKRKKKFTDLSILVSRISARKLNR
jgi:hypothetical protein